MKGGKELWKQGGWSLLQQLQHKCIPPSQELNALSPVALKIGGERDEEEESRRGRRRRRSGLGGRLVGGGAALKVGGGPGGGRKEGRKRVRLQ